MSDLVQPFQLGAGLVRGRLVRIEKSLNSILKNHNYPPSVSVLMGQTLAMAAALAGALKFDGIFTLQVQSDGPVSLLLADVTSDGHLRGYARFDPDRLTPDIAEATDLAAPVDVLLGKGHLAFTIDQGPDTDRYQGIVELVGPTLAQSALQYFAQSEQLATAIEVAAGLSDDGIWRAAALTISKMPSAGMSSPTLSPEEAEDSWVRATMLLSTLSKGEMLDPALEPERLLYRLYHQELLECFDEKPIEAHCRCSRGRIASALRTIPRSEIEELVEDDGQVKITCEFCQTTYGFTPRDIESVYNPD